MDGILKEVFIAASKGKVIIEGDPFFIAFNTNIYGPEGLQYTTGINPEFPTLEINNFELFQKLLLECTMLQRSRMKYHYRTPKDELKFLIVFTLVNATVFDFANPIAYLERSKSFLQDETFKDFEETVALPDSPFYLKNLHIMNTRQNIHMETPNKMMFALEDEVDGKEYQYILPEISYGITYEKNSKGEPEPVCYIYSILDKYSYLKKEDDIEVMKRRVKRSLFQLNKDVENDSEYNILEVSPSAILSLTAFLALLEDKGIKQVRVVEYLPERYLSRQVAADSLPKMRDELLARNDRIQTNATDKFIKTFLRMMYHLDNIDWYFNQIFGDQVLRFQLTETNKPKEDLVNQIYQSVKSKVKEKHQQRI